LRETGKREGAHCAFFAWLKEMPAATVKARTVAAYKSAAGTGGRISAMINLAG